MSATRFLGLISVLALICGKGRTESVIPANEQDQMTQANDNSFSIQIPLGQGNVIQADNQVSPVQRRISLEDFFLNRNQQEQPSPPAIQAPVTQFQVQQPDPNSLMLVRDAQFPSPTGGIISRLLLARRMLRLRRIARRLTIIPRLFGLGLRNTLQRSPLGSQSPLALFSNRIGEAYNPRDFVFGSKGFSYQNNATSDTQQQDSNTDQLQQQSRGIPIEADPYYDDIRDSNFEIHDNSNIRGTNGYDSQDINQLKEQQDILNSLTDEQQLLLLQQLQNYQQQLNQLHERLNSQPNNNPQNYQNQVPVNDQLPTQYQQPQQNYQNAQANQYQQAQNNAQVEQIQHQQQTQAFNEQQLEHIRQLQLQLLREQQLQQQLQQLQLTQQAQNLKQHQNLVSVEQETNYQEKNNQQPLIQSNNVQHQDSDTAGDRTEGSSYPSAIGIGNSAGYGGSAGFGAGGQTIGVGINVGVKPPAVDIQVTKPGASGIKPFPPLVNPIAPKPVPKPPVEPLVPIGILPKPMLNLKGRLFFGAEMGKGVGIKAGTGR